MTDEKKKNEKTEFDELEEQMKKFDDQYTDHHEVPTGEAVAVRVSEDEMKANVTVAPPDSGEEVTKDKVIEELNKIGVVHGIDEEAIDDIFTYGSYNVEVVVAKGTPPSDGTNAKIEYKFDTSAEKKAKVQVDEHGNVDHRQTNLVESVEEGTLLATKVPAVHGEEGMTVMGDKLPAG